MERKLVLLGYSGHAYSVIEAIRSCGQLIVGYCDVVQNSSNPFEIQYLGTEAALNFDDYTDETAFFPSVGDGRLRRRIDEYIMEKSFLRTSIIHNSAIVSPSAKIGDSVFVAAGGMINALAVIGKGCIINSGAIVDHECEIDDYSHIAPGAILTGNVRVGHNTFIGANATIKQGIRIGSNAIIGAGSVVLKDIADGEVFVGNPARKLK